MNAILDLIKGEHPVVLLPALSQVHSAIVAEIYRDKPYELVEEHCKWLTELMDVSIKTMWRSDNEVVQTK